MYTNILLPTTGWEVANSVHARVLLAKPRAKVTAVCVTAKLSGQDILKIYNPDILFGTAAGVVRRSP